MDYLLDLGLNEEDITLLGKNITDEDKEKIILFKNIIKENFLTLKNVGAKNFKEIFINHIHIFFRNPDKLKFTFDKYDPSDLIRCLEKNGAIIEKL